MSDTPQAFWSPPGGRPINSLEDAEIALAEIRRSLEFLTARILQPYQDNVFVVLSDKDGDTGASIRAYSSQHPTQASEVEIRQGSTVVFAIGANAEIVLEGGAGLYRGSGSPEGVVTAAVGSIYQRTDGGASTSIYVKESGASSTGWVAK